MSETKNDTINIPPVKRIIRGVPNKAVIGGIIIIMLIGLYMYIQLRNVQFELESCRSSCSVRD